MAGRMLVVDVYNIASGTDCTLQIYDNNGIVLPLSPGPNQAPNNEPEHLVYWQLPYTGAYYIKVAATSVGSSSNYNMWISMKPIPSSGHQLARPTLEASKVTQLYDLLPGSGRSCFVCSPAPCAVVGAPHATDGHTGTDYGWVDNDNPYASWDTVYSATSGWVHSVGHYPSSGYWVDVRNANYRTIYIHLRNSSHFVSQHQVVTIGQRLSYTGNSGTAPNPPSPMAKHLHLNFFRTTNIDLRICPYHTGHFYWGCSKDEV